MVQVRNAQPADAKLLKQLIDEMGQHERMSVFASEESLTVDGFGPKPMFHALLGMVDGTVAGYALFYDCYSSFQGRGIFLEDLFVRQGFRGSGVGNAMLSNVAEIALKQGCFGIMFNVLKWNLAALKFFDRAGASLLSEHHTLCLTAASLREIAEKTSAAAAL
jgi:GNAT superfamily N-acetyltransferase